VVADFVEDGELRQEYLTWTEVARRNGRTAHALMEQETILRGPGGDGEDMQCSDRLAPDQVEALLSIVSRHTSSSSGWFLLWDGFGDLSERAFRDDGPKVTHPMRSYYLLRGPLSAYGDSPDNPSYWCPTTGRGPCAPTPALSGHTWPGRPAWPRPGSTSVAAFGP
jgi:hypothetical protein